MFLDIYTSMLTDLVVLTESGHSQPNYSTSVHGDLASAAISNTHYPPSNRGAGLVFENVIVNTGERMLSGLAQEFVLFGSREKRKTRNSRGERPPQP